MGQGVVYPWGRCGLPMGQVWCGQRLSIRQVALCVHLHSVCWYVGQVCAATGVCVRRVWAPPLP